MSSGNALNTLFVAATDVAYRGGSIYHLIPDHVMLLVALSVLITGGLMLGCSFAKNMGAAAWDLNACPSPTSIRQGSSD
jgi:hypothetical protein